MKKFNKNAVVVALALSVVIGLTGSSVALAATSPSLGVAATFGVLSNTFTTIGVTTTISGSPGDVGYTTLSVPDLYKLTNGTTYIGGGLGNATYQQAGLDQGSALTTLNNQGGCTDISGLGPLEGVVVAGGAPGTFTPGCYSSGAAMDITANGIVTLNGAGTYIFRPDGALTTGANSKIVLSGGALACNVFWTPTGETTIGAYTGALPNPSAFVGTIIDAAGINLGQFANLSGRALAFGEHVQTNSNIITVPDTCAAAVVAPISSSNINNNASAGGIIIPVIGILKVPDPLALPAGPGPVTYNYTVWNVGRQQPLADVTVTDDKCGPVVLRSGDINGDGKLDITETWKYSCATTVSSTVINTAVAKGYSDDAFRRVTIDTAVATVVVGVPLTPPLINIVKVPSRLTPFPFGGGNVIYSYVVTNPGVVAMHDVVVTDDKCSPVSGPVAGDVNGNGLLDPGESWAYTCQTNIAVSTSNTARAEGQANGFTALDYAFATVLVATPLLPNTGLPPGGKSTSWDMVLLVGILALVSTSIIAVLAKRK